MYLIKLEYGADTHLYNFILYKKLRIVSITVSNYIIKTFIIQEFKKYIFLIFYAL